MQEISVERGRVTANVVDGILEVNLVRFGSVVENYTLDLTVEALPSVIETPSEGRYTSELALIPDGTGGVWAVAGRYDYIYEESNAEFIVQRLDSELAPVGDTAQYAVSGDLYYRAYCAMCGGDGFYPPRVSGTVQPDGTLLLAYGASPDEESDYDALQLGVAAIGGASGELLYQTNTGLRGEPVLAVIEGSGEEVELVVESQFAYRDEWISTFPFLFDYDEVEAVIDDLRLITRHDPETGVVIGDPLIESESSEAIFGTFGEDSLLGTDGSDTIYGLYGDDRLGGEAGDDTVRGGDGSDGIKGGTGNDSLSGGAGSDHLAAGAGSDTVSGGDGHDLIGGGTGDDLLEGGAGDDTVRGGQGNDSISGSAQFWSSTDAPVDRDVLSGGYGNDRVFGSYGGDTLAGGFGNDTLNGRAGDDVIGGGSGDDSVAGAGGNDSIYAGQGSDSVRGFGGNDALNGGYGGDTLLGGSGDDRLSGGPGNDILRGDDAIEDRGIDIFVFSRLTESETDWVLDFTKFDDRIEIGGVEGANDAARFDALDLGFATGSDGDVGAFIRVAGHTIILDGVNPATLSEEDFIFV